MMLIPRFPLFLLVTISCLAVSSMVNANSWTAWSELNLETGLANIFVANESTQKTKQITHAGFNITPTLYVVNNSLWLAWVDRGLRDQYFLYSAQMDANSLEINSIETVPVSNLKIYAPNIHIDFSATAWLTWAGSGDSYGDIYLSQHTGKDWSKAISITSNDLVDGVPIIQQIENKQLILTWEQITETKVSYPAVLINDFFNNTKTESPDILMINDFEVLKPLTRSTDVLPKWLTRKEVQILMGTKFSEPDKDDEN